MADTIGQSLWEEGRLKGRSEGEAAGQSAGELRTARRLLQRLLADRFGTVPEAVLRRIESTTDVERLTVAALQVSRIATPDDLQL